MLIVMSINILISQDIVGKWELDVEMDKGIFSFMVRGEKIRNKSFSGLFCCT